MLVVKGVDVSFELARGGEIVLPRDDGMMHDSSGDAWPACSLLFGPFEDEGESEDAAHDIAA